MDKVGQDLAKNKAKLDVEDPLSSLRSSLQIEITGGGQLGRGEGEALELAEGILTSYFGRVSGRLGSVCRW